MQIHFIAIGGAIMHQLAIVSKYKGYKITGSDDEIRNPAHDNLKKEGLLPEKEGWFPEKIHKDLDAIILGMHAREDNPELKHAQELGIPIYSFPEYIYNHSKDKKRVVIAGSHGKTSTTSMIMHVLKHEEMDFDYLVGAKIEGFEHSVRLTDAPVIILEGDEYMASPLERRPKIHFYHPDIAVITGIAWDHINVFPTYENYFEQFKIFLNQLNAENTLVYNAEDREIIRLLETENPDLRLMPYATPNYSNKGSKVILPTDSGDKMVNVFGVHNLQNMEAARKVCNLLGVSDNDFYDAIQTFKGAARRLENVFESDELVVFRDFAHAPSKLKATMSAVRQQFQNYKLIACFELHTFSSLNKEFLSQYAGSMTDFDSGAVYFSSHSLKMKKMPLLSEKLVKKSFGNNALNIFVEPDQLSAWIQKEIDRSKKPVCLLLMSSGTFDGMNIGFRKGV